MGNNEALLDCLEFAHGAIIDAILTEDGLDGDTGLKIIRMIEEQLTKNKRMFTSVDETDGDAV